MSGPAPSAFAFSGGRLLVVKREEGFALPDADWIEDRMDVVVAYTLAADGRGVTTLLTVADDAEAPDGHAFLGLRELLSMASGEVTAEALRARHLEHWLRTHRFCGRCGAVNEPHESDLSLICPACDHSTFPKISPAVIVAVRRGDRILLARSARFPDGGYSVLAGFVEPGESLEQCVRREVKEEVGLEVERIEYFGSQPWPFPDSLMIGFTAWSDEGEVSIDGVEIVEADWFEAGEIPPVPPGFSIARELVDAFVTEYDQDPDTLPRWGHS